ncbi:hypothetical protein KC963_02270 [Candidatus Saccharibacteria bacterium]|nr:hypothetical protein [Candidatus Saccharibacteria bacterium]
MALIIEDGISTKSFVISMVFTVIGLASVAVFVNLFDKNTPTIVQLAGVAFSLSMLAVGFAAWTGIFEKKKEAPHRRFERERGFEPDDNVKELKPEKPKKVAPMKSGVDEFVDNFVSKETK